LSTCPGASWADFSAARRLDLQKPRLHAVACERPSATNLVRSVWARTRSWSCGYRDREGNFDSKLIAKYQRRFLGFDEKIVSMYARGMSVREIQGHSLEIYGLDVSPDLNSTVTDAMLTTVSEWQNRPLEPSYPQVFFYTMHVKSRSARSTTQPRRTGGCRARMPLASARHR
jgi:hypothetical protein